MRQFPAAERFFCFHPLRFLPDYVIILMSQLSLEDICLSFCRDTALEILALRQQGGGFLPCLTTKILRIYSSRFNWYINRMRPHPLSRGMRFVVGRADSRYPTASFRGAYQFRRCYGTHRAFFTVWLSSHSASIRFRRTLDHGSGTAGRQNCRREFAISTCFLRHFLV